MKTQKVFSTSVLQMLDPIQLDIHSRRGSLQSLSNFASYHFRVSWKNFTLDCNSMEGFLQSLKFDDPSLQRSVAGLVGSSAKKKGKNQDWKSTQQLWWNGSPIERNRVEYQELLDVAYESLSQNESFAKNLLESGSAILTHHIGKDDPHETILTRDEFCSRLMRLRDHLRKMTTVETRM